LSYPANSQSLPISVQSLIEKRITDSHADAASTLDGKSELFFHADEPFHAASTMKVPVMIELFRQAQEGKLHFADKIPIRNEFDSIVDGSPYKLDPADDSESDLYKAEEQTRTLAELCELMQQSGNQSGH
jgi:beta-lactamase class A